MFARSTSQEMLPTTASSYYDGSSSPDPLQSSPASFPYQRRSVSPARRTTPSPVKNVSSTTRSLRIQDLTIRTPPRTVFPQSSRSSPTRSQSTSYVTSQQLPEGTSPWRIRVTVETEPESDDEVNYDEFDKENSGRIAKQTTKVPLRGGDIPQVQAKDKPVGAIRL